MYSLAEQPQIPYSISDTLWSPGSAPNPWWDLEKLHTWSKHLPWTHPKLSLTTNPLWPRGDKVRAVQDLGLLWLPRTWLTGMGETRGEGQAFHSVPGSIARIQPHPNTSPAESGVVVAQVQLYQHCLECQQTINIPPLPSLPESWRLRMKLHKHWVNKTILWTSQTLFNFL